MQVGVTMRNMGPESSRAMMADCARDSDAVLSFLDRCFAGDVVEANGQPFLFLP